MVATVARPIRINACNLLEQRSLQRLLAPYAALVEPAKPVTAMNYVPTSMTGWRRYSIHYRSYRPLMGVAA